MSSYLPKDSSGTYAEGGGLFAIGMFVCFVCMYVCAFVCMYVCVFVRTCVRVVCCYVGLIHANHGSKVIDYLSQELRSNSSEVRIWGGTYL